MPLDEFEFLDKAIKARKERKKIESEVFDPKVLDILIHLLNNKYIESIDFPISKGKEAYVFRATKGSKLLNQDLKKKKSKFAALKIYMIETSDFKHMQNYIRGDPRFRKVPHSKKEIVYEWTKKEFRNLRLCYEEGISVPEPYYFRNNVLLMEFIGDENGTPAPLLKKIGPPEPKKNFNQIIKEIKKLYSIGLVHSDLSEYNILVTTDSEGKKSKLHIIDVGQTVLIDHPMANEFFERDIKNLIRYFSEFGVKADADEIIKEIKETKIV
ncbi:MAG: serine protein kinase RIO [Candidatus Micrarchaeia archaeon]